MLRKLVLTFFSDFTNGEEEFNQKSTKIPRPPSSSWRFFGVILVKQHQLISLKHSVDQVENNPVFQYLGNSSSYKTFI